VAVGVLEEGVERCEGFGYAIALLTNHSPGGLQVLDAVLQAAGVARDDPQPVEDAPLAVVRGGLRDGC
jgi:hypothetical protein